MLYIFLRKKRYIIMKISTKGRYAMRLMLDLALNNTGAPISLKDVARRQEISDKYLEQIISVLNRAVMCAVCVEHRGDICCVKHRRSIPLE